MFRPLKILDIELSQPLTNIDGLDGYIGVKALVRLHGSPIGYVQQPVIEGRCLATALSKAILDQHSWAIIRHLVSDGLAASPKLDGLRIADLVAVAHPVYEGAWPTVTVAVCTRDRAEDLAMCLGALVQLDYPVFDILVVDNAPSNNATERLVQSKYPYVRYVRESRPGLDWARNHAIKEAKGEIVAFTDDDVVVDPGWLRALAQVFAENPEVMAVTGLVVPYELETEAQILFEIYGGFGRGFERKWYRLYPDSRVKECYHLGAGVFGTGANMAYRRSIFEEIDDFDPALDVGTVTNGGGDIEMFFRILQEGHTLAYEPAAIVRHRHRRDYARLRTQITNNGIGFYSFLVRSALAYPDECFSIIRFGLWWLWWWNIRRLLSSLVQPSLFPRDLIVAELQGVFQGLGRYQKARKHADEITSRYCPTSIQ